MRRWSSVLVALIILSLSTATAASAATVQRTLTTSLGANGSAALDTLSDGTGMLRLSIVGLVPSTEYTLEIRAGKCAPLGAVLATPFPVIADEAGVVETFRNLSNGEMNGIWGPIRNQAIVFRIGNASGTLCGALTYPVSTRVAITALGINLAVIKGPSGYPKCRVAMYQSILWQPREAGVTFLFAHARTGMFLPLLSRSKIRNGASLIGMVVKVYTSDSKVHTYKIDKVRRHVTSAQNALGVTTERLWLQTSEGPNFRYPKLIVEGQRLSTANATFAASHPVARPVNC